MVLLKYLKSISNIKYYILVCSLILFYPALHFFIYALLAVNIVKSDWGLRFFSMKKAPYIFLFLYIMWVFLSLSYTSNLSRGIHYIEKGMPLLLVAIVGLFSSPRKPVSFQYVGATLRMSSIVFLIVCFFTLLFSFWRGSLLGQINTYGLSNIDSFAPVLHRTYASVLLLMSLVPSFIGLRDKIGSRRISLIISLIILFAIYWSGARVAFLSALLLLIVFFIYQYYHKVSKSIFYPSLLLVIVLFSFVLFSSPRVKQSYWNLKQGKDLSQTFDRYVSWQTALSIVKENPLLGVGVGDAQDKLNARYVSVGNTLWANRELNAHNQYLQTLLETGLIGLILLLAFLTSLVFSFDKRKRIYAISILVLYGLNFLFESMLLRNSGTMPLAFFLLVLHISDNGNEELPHRITSRLDKLGGLVTFIFILVGAVLLFRSEMEASVPRTYMTVDYSKVVYEDLPQKECLPMPTSGTLLNAHNISLRPDRVGKFQSFDVYRFSQDVDRQIAYSYWCYVSEDCNLEKVMTYIYNKGIVAQQACYDLDQKGTWQCLQIQVDSVLQYTGLGARLDVYEEEDIEGYVIFALPEINY